MWHPARGTLRLTRSLIVGSSVSVVAVAAHLVGGGHHSSWLAVMPAAVMVAAVSWFLADRRLALPPLLGLLLIAQVVVHALSNWLSGHWVGHHLEMLVSHAVAALISAVLLRYGDGLLWLISALIRAVVTPWALLQTFLPIPTRPRLVALPALVVAPRALHLTSIWHRGPPVR